MNRRIKALLIMGILLLAAGSAAGEMVKPNMYEFAGGGLHVSYASTSLSGDPLLTYRDARRTLAFRGDEIRISLTEIGQQVTVTLEQVPDLRTTTFTILVPDINLDDANGTALFATYGITTTHRTSIGGPGLVRGPLQLYSAVPLRGKARSVVSIQPGQASIHGVVTLSPTCPGPQRPGQVCEKPYADAAVVILDPQGKVVGSTMTNSAGIFNISVAPGAYTVHIDTPGLLPYCPDTPVKAPDGGIASVRINCDTGIR